MTVVVGCAAKGSPGVTTTLSALALTWPRDVLLVGADPAGDDLRASILQASAPDQCGVLELALSARRGDARLEGHVVAMSAGERSVWVLPGVIDPAQADVLAPMWSDVLRVVARSERDILIDIGRLPTAGFPRELATHADAFALVLRPTLLSSDRSAPALSRLRERLESSAATASVGLLCVGETPYPPDEVAQALQAPLLGVLPFDAASVEGLVSGQVPWRRPLMRAAGAVARSITTQLSAPAELVATR